MSFSIIATGSALPKKVVTNDDLAQFLDTSDEWIVTRTGIKTRHVATDETTSSLAVEAAKNALDMAHLSPSDLDLIICTTVTHDYITPSLACVVQGELGADCPALDINAACSGFLYALDVADGYFARGRVEKVLVVSSELLTRITDWRDRATAVLFGDGAGAVVLGKGNALRSIKIGAKGNPDPLYSPNVGGISPWRADKTEPECFLHMNGQEVFKFAVSTVSADLIDVAQEAGIDVSSLDHAVLHQANLRILDAAARKCGLAPEKMEVIIDETGNMSSACIPIALDRLVRSGRLHSGEWVALAGFGAGYTSGAACFKWD